VTEPVDILDDADWCPALFMYQFDLESLALAHAYLGTDVA